MPQFVTPTFFLLVLAGAVAGLFVGAIPGLSVATATALLVSVTYSWSAENAIAAIMGVYVVGVFSGAVSAILINIPGAPSSVATTFDGYPLARKGRARDAIRYAAVYSVLGSVFGLSVLLIVQKPVSALALQFQPMDYFLLGLFGLTAVSLLSGSAARKGFLSAAAGLMFAMVGLDPVLGTPRLCFGSYRLQAGIGVVPALVGLFGFSEVLFRARQRGGEQRVTAKEQPPETLRSMLRFWPSALYSSTIGTLIGALPGAGSPIAALVAYGEARRTVKTPSAPFGEGAIEGLVASESSNNACIGGALIPMLTLAVPGDAVTAILLAVFHVHGLRPGPMFVSGNPEMFAAILTAGFFASLCLLPLGWYLAPRLGRVLSVPKRFLLPAVALLCVIGAYAANNRAFDVLLMLLFGALGFLMRLRGFPTAPMILGLVLGGMMDQNFRRAIALAVTEEHVLFALFVRPITLVLIALILFALLSKTPAASRIAARLGKKKGTSA